MAQPIDLNIAYLKSLDTKENVLVKIGNTMLTANAGVNIRSVLTVVGGVLTSASFCEFVYNI